MLSGLVRHLLRREETGARDALGQAESIEATILAALAAVIPQIEVQAGEPGAHNRAAKQYDTYLPPVAAILLALLRLVRGIAQRLRLAARQKPRAANGANAWACRALPAYRIEAIDSG